MKKHGPGNIKFTTETFRKQTLLPSSGTETRLTGVLDYMRGIWTVIMEEEYVEGAASMALAAVFSVYFPNCMEFSKENL
jgi:hypothetical protein